MNLSPNFALGEFADDRRESSIPANVVPALRVTAQGLERVRRIIGVPLTISDGYRTQAENAATPGSSATSHHQTGFAADVVPVGVPIEIAARRVLDDLGALGAFDEFLIYPTHLHFAFAPSNRRKVLRRVGTKWVPVLSTPIAPADATRTRSAPLASLPQSSRAPIGGWEIIAILLGLALYFTFKQ